MRIKHVNDPGIGLSVLEECKLFFNVAHQKD